MPNSTTQPPEVPLDIYGVPLYQPNDPYHYDFDNKPIKSLVVRDQILSQQINQNTKDLRESAADQSSLSIRLDQSLDPKGNLKPTAVDESLHNIAFHSNGSKQISEDEGFEYASLGYNVGTNPEFVVMLKAEKIGRAHV